MTANNDKLMRAYDKAFQNPGVTIPLEGVVICDACNADWTDNPGSGGFIFGSHGICPTCEPDYRKSVEKFNETHFIKAECPKGQSFGDFVRAYRGPDSGITVGPLRGFE